MKMTNKALFIQAFTDAERITNAGYADKAAFAHYTFSDRFEKRMQRLIARHNRISLGTRRRLSRALLAAVLALLILLTGLMSVSASRKKILEFLVTTFSNGTEVLVLDTPSDTPQTIETAYTLSAVPKGFSLVQDDMDNLGVMTIWRNSAGEEIAFYQELLSMSFSFDTENKYEEINLNEYPAYMYWADSTCGFCWSDGSYWFSISAPIEYKNDLINMAKTIVEKK